MPEVLPGWTAEMKKVLAQFEPSALKLGYMPRDDLAAIGKL